MEETLTIISAVLRSVPCLCISVCQNKVLGVLECVRNMPFEWLLWSSHGYIFLLVST